MGMPVKLSEDLVNQARHEAKASNRSITAQIEHWAVIGSSVERALAHDDLLAVKRGDLETAFPEEGTRTAILSLLHSVTQETGRKDLAKALKKNRTVYQSDPNDPAWIERIDAAGRRTKGRFEDGRFIPAPRLRRRGR